MVLVESLGRNKGKHIRNRKQIQPPHLGIGKLNYITLLFFRVYMHVNLSLEPDASFLLATAFSK